MNNKELEEKKSKLAKEIENMKTNIKKAETLISLAKPLIALKAQAVEMMGYERGQMETIKLFEVTTTKADKEAVQEAVEKEAKKQESQIKSKLEKEA